MALDAGPGRQPVVSADVIISPGACWRLGIGIWADRAEFEGLKLNKSFHSSARRLTRLPQIPLPAPAPPFPPADRHRTGAASREIDPRWRENQQGNQSRASGHAAPGTGSSV